MPEGPVLACGSCGSGPLEPVLDLGPQPLPQAMPGRAGLVKYPLRLVQCPQCTLVQLDYIVSQHELFPADYPYATGNTKALRVHFDQLAGEVTAMIGHEDLVVDIGANDGTFLGLVHQEWLREDRTRFRPRVLAIEPTNQARKCRQAGIGVVQDYFTAALAARIRQDHGTAKVIVTANTFGHVPDPHDFLDGVTELLAGDGTLIIDNQDWHNVVNDLQIDTIYHEHLRYYSPASLSHLLARHGLLVTSLTRIAMHGGSFRAIAVREKPGLAVRAIQLAARLNELLSEAAKAGPVYAIGAPTRATSLVNYAGLGKYLYRACEIAGSEKIGAVIPGTTVPIVDEQALFGNQPPYALLLAWDLYTDIIPKLRANGYNGKIIIPLPEPRIFHG